MALYACPIPKLALDGVHATWVQPEHKEIQFTTDGYAVVTKEGMDRLQEYSHSSPAGCYPGRMWKRQSDPDTWFLCWYIQDPENTAVCDVKYRRILLKDVFDLLNPGGQDHQ